MNFPLLNRTINEKRIVYLDNASTTQKPKEVIDAITNYYQSYNANIHRGVYKISEEATIAYEKAHEVVADFINADKSEIIFTKGTTEGLNLLAYTLCKTLKPGDEIVISDMEHHSNLVPWQQMAKQYHLKLKFIRLKDFELDMDHAKELITDKTKVVSVVHMSNVLGTINPIKELAELAHTHGALMVVDAAQSVPHMPIDVKDLDCDFFAFSAHKMYGPTGIGILYGKKKLLETLDPFQFGGDMIAEVTKEDSSWNDIPWKFEAGTPNIAGAVGLMKAVEWLRENDMNKVYNTEQELTQYAREKLKTIPDLTIYGPQKNRAGVISFTINGIHPHDLASLLDREGICVRGGHHCAMPLMKTLGLYGTTRVSIGVYSTKDDIDILIKAIMKAKEVFA